MKKVITGHDTKGKSILKSVEPEELTVGSDTLDWHEVFATYTSDTIPIDQSDAQDRTRFSDKHNVFPKTGETIFRILDFKPGKVTPEAFARVQRELPGFLEHLELDNPGMHTTNSVDYGIIMKGKIVLELDDGESVEMEAGDVFVQNGTRHAWRTIEPCRMAVILTGVNRA